MKKLECDKIRRYSDCCSAPFVSFNLSVTFNKKARVEHRHTENPGTIIATQFLSFHETPSVDPTVWNSNLTLKMTIQTMTSYCILPVNESHFKLHLPTSTVSAHFWVAISNVCKLRWRSLDDVAGGNLSATLPMLQKGFGGCRCVSAWEKCKCSAETTPHTHPHIFPFFIVLLFFSVSLSTPLPPPPLLGCKIFSR